MFDESERRVGEGERMNEREAEMSGMRAFVARRHASYTGCFEIIAFLFNLEYICTIYIDNE